MLGSLNGHLTVLSSLTLLNIDRVDIKKFHPALAFYLGRLLTYKERGIKFQS